MAAYPHRGYGAVLKLVSLVAVLAGGIALSVAPVHAASAVRDAAPRAAVIGPDASPATATAVATTSEQPAPHAYQVKAVYLYNFAQFVEWPPSVFDGPEAPIVFGVLGSDPFGSFLDDVVRDERVNGRRLVVRRFHSVAEIDTCHILYVGHSDPTTIGRALDALRGRGVLTVGDAELFNQRGGMIRFVTENNRVRLRINVQAARAAGLVISAKLLRPAEIVTNPRHRYLVRR